MSFFLGKDINNNNILHITNGTNTIIEMKSGTMSNTAFHSDLPYVTYEKFDFISSMYRSESVRQSSGYTYWAPSGYFVKLPEEFYSIFDNNPDRLVIAVIDGAVYQHPTGAHAPNGYRTDGLWYSVYMLPWYPTNTPNFTSDYIQDRSYPTPSSSNPWCFLRTDTLTECYFLVFNIDKGIVEDVNFTASNITLNSEIFNIKGVDIANLKFIIEKSINAQDDVISINSYPYQLINSTDNLPGMELSTETNKSISVGGKTIFTDSIVKNSLIKGASYIDTTYPFIWRHSSSRNSQQQFTFNMGLKDGDLIYYQRTQSNASNYAGETSFILSYREGEEVLFIDGKSSSSYIYVWIKFLNGDLHYRWLSNVTYNYIDFGATVYINTYQ